MDAVLGVLGTVGSVLGTVSSIFSSVGEVLSKMGSTIFILGFIGILLTFLWFLFRYLDKKQLTLPTVVFVFFFFVFLSANLLLITQDAKTINAAETQPISAEIASVTPPAEGETRV